MPTIFQRAARLNFGTLKQIEYVTMFSCHLLQAPNAECDLEIGSSIPSLISEWVKTYGVAFSSAGAPATTWWFHKHSRAPSNSASSKKRVCWDELAYNHFIRAYHIMIDMDLGRTTFRQTRIPCGFQQISAVCSWRQVNCRRCCHLKQWFHHGVTTIRSSVQHKKHLPNLWFTSCCLYNCWNFLPPIVTPLVPKTLRAFCQA